ncbi:MAG: type II toxin-antitoxin system HicA family toxin [Candidatus Poribacteria bacterium]|nr:type II toxin-antitoxin system HicA family toxin [Candidatus Poribacteria bacterium]
MANRERTRPSWKQLRSSRRLIKQLEREGWYLHKVKGDHHHFKHDTQLGKVTVPHPRKDTPINTLRRIYQQAGWDWN